jgi:hypothetical protein
VATTKFAYENPPALQVKAATAAETDPILADLRKKGK